MQEMAALSISPPPSILTTYNVCFCTGLEKSPRFKFAFLLSVGEIPHCVLFKCGFSHSYSFCGGRGVSNFLLCRKTEPQCLECQ